MIILITGSRKGIGRRLAEHYLDLGHKVIGCSRSESELEHENYTHYLADVTNEKDVKMMLKGVRKEYGHIDVLINNAGIASMNHFLLTPTETARKVMDTNYFGTLIMTREAARLLRKSDHGRVVNFTSVAVALSLEGESIYLASKAAIEALTKVTAKELGQYEITVNAIGPTPIDTSLIAAVPKEKIASLIDKQAVKRYGEFEDVINLIDFYIKPESDFITGQIVYLGGIF
ncbi:MAG: SDR family oxidoreductase [Firmicutes bacterium]|jgi:3-oxoacyl-[acyl-carrier protein] reductase|nr:SDR family oxidoreductase [Bacillota bacterium]